MRVQDGLLRPSATDLANHLGCRHLTELNRAAAEGRAEPPAWADPMLAVLQQRGLSHEEAYVNHLRGQGLRIAQLRDEDVSTVERTVAAMRDGVDVIVQAELSDGRWSGRADVLLRLEEPSRLGEWSYEVLDTKLARDTRGGTVLQLCLYSDLLAALQGHAPSHMYVVKPGDGFPRETYRFADFQAYYRLVRQRLETVLEAAPSSDSYPDPVPQCDICRWWKDCDKRRHDDDHLCLVAGIRSLQIAELQRQGIQTLESFAERATPLAEKPERGSEEAYARVHGQAKVQLEGRRKKATVYEFLPVEEGRGFLRLPAPSTADVFFDIEADPFVEGGGLEYLLGFSFVNDGGEPEYRALWAMSHAEEKRRFEEFIDFLMDRWRKHPDMYVYHFSPYEPGAIKRLMGRHATREVEVDQLLRGERFVDLHGVTRQGLRASVERYSLKDLERFFGFTRAVELPDASKALRRVESALELGAEPDASEDDRRAVEAYNRDDCLATDALRTWLEERRSELEAQGQTLLRPESQAGEASDAVEEREQQVQEVFDRLVDELPEDRAAWSHEDRARWLLAHLLDYFRREDRCAWWELFRLHDLDHEELLEERKALSGLEFICADGGTAKCPIHRYRFPAQEVSVSVGDELHEARGDVVGKVQAINGLQRTVDIKKRAKAADLHPSAVVVNERVVPQPLDTSLLALGRSVAEHGVDGDGPFRAARDLLLKEGPRLTKMPEGALRQAGEDVVAAAVRLAQTLDHGVLPIQGPPGTGKTFAGSRMIVDLARRGKRVGVTAVSHKVIRNLLEKALDAAEEEGVDLEVTHKVSKPSDTTPDGLEEVRANDAALAALDDGKVLGGTAWLWARDDSVEALDYLFVDEAGQMSLAHVLAASRCAHNLVFLGDPQQLDQPQKGAHPEGAEVAALAHILDGHETIPDDRGLFLDVTWRLHPQICRLTSELYYEGRLESRAGLEQQVLAGPSAFAGSGLFYVPVTHEGNQNISLEEVDAIARIVEDLVQEETTWTDPDGATHPLHREDILVVAPFNAQVSSLSERLDGVPVGTVDKFQGQEAPVVIYSMTSSSSEDAPRGLSFLYSPNRLNVATSRARCVCILVGTRRLLEPDCRTPGQMRAANGVCRFHELATVVELAAFR